MSHLHKIRVGHAYDGRVRGYGARVLVNRPWSRGLSTVRADLDEWCKTVAPSGELSTCYGHDPELFEEFRERYRAELDEHERVEALRHPRALPGAGTSAAHWHHAPRDQSCDRATRPARESTAVSG